MAGLEPLATQLWAGHHEELVLRSRAMQMTTEGWGTARNDGKSPRDGQLPSRKALDPRTQSSRPHSIPSLTLLCCSDGRVVLITSFL